MSRRTGISTALKSSDSGNEGKNDGDNGMTNMLCSQRTSVSRHLAYRSAPDPSPDKKATPVAAKPLKHI